MFFNLRHNSFKTKGRLLRMVDQNGSKSELFKTYKIAFYPFMEFVLPTQVHWVIHRFILDNKNFDNMGTKISHFVDDFVHLVWPARGKSLLENY